MPWTSSLTSVATVNGVATFVISFTNGTETYQKTFKSDNPGPNFVESRADQEIRRRQSLDDYVASCTIGAIAPVVLTDSVTLAARKAEIANDPKGLGYAGKSDAAIAALMNSIVGPGAEAIALPSITKDAFLALTIPAAIRLALSVGADGQALDAAVVAKWSAVLEQAKATSSQGTIPLTMLSAIGDPVAERVLNQGELAALTVRVGSRIEKLEGASTVITAQQVGEAR